MKTITKIGYTLEELKAKLGDEYEAFLDDLHTKHCASLSEGNTLEDDIEWYEGEFAKDHNLEIDDISYSIGDRGQYVAIEGSVNVADFLKAHKMGNKFRKFINAGTEVLLYHSTGNYSKVQEFQYHNWPEETTLGDDAKFECWIEDAVNDIVSKIEEGLQAEYENWYSLEYFTGSCEANEYTFTLDGEWV